MLETAQESDRARKPVEALFHYRSLIKAHPSSREARTAEARIKVLAEMLAVDAQEARASTVMNRARILEESGDVKRALEHLRQVIKVYPKTPSARVAARRIQALEGS